MPLMRAFTAVLSWTIVQVTQSRILNFVVQMNYKAFSSAIVAYSSEEAALQS